MRIDLNSHFSWLAFSLFSNQIKQQQNDQYKRYLLKYFSQE